MAPFYIWFAVLTLFLIASLAAVLLPSGLPVPWSGLLLVILVFSVSALPMLYGRVYIRDAMLGFSRESSRSIDNGGDPHSADNIGGGIAGDLRLEEDLFGGEVFPLLGSRDDEGAAHNADIENNSLTWKQCLRVSLTTHQVCSCILQAAMSVFFMARIDCGNIWSPTHNFLLPASTVSPRIPAFGSCS